MATEQPLTLEFQCGRCDARLTVKSLLSGKKINCPKCHKKIFVPSSSGEIAVAPDKLPLSSAGRKWPSAGTKESPLSVGCNPADAVAAAGAGGLGGQTEPDRVSQELSPEVSRHLRRADRLAVEVEKWLSEHGDLHDRTASANPIPGAETPSGQAGELERARKKIADLQRQLEQARRQVPRTGSNDIGLDDMSEKTIKVQGGMIMSRRLLMVVAAGLMFSIRALAGPPGHYVNGVEGLKAASLPPPGVYYRMYNVYYEAGRLRDNDGDRLNVDFKVAVFANVHRIIWVSEIALLGGHLFMDALVPLIHTDLKIGAMGVSDDRWGIGDPFVEPLGVKWHGSRYDAAAGIGFYLPLGTYEPDEPASAGKDMWTLMLTAGGTRYFDAEKTWAVSVLGRFETHSSQNDLDIRPGNSLHFEYGLSKTFNRTLDVGLAGYCHWQVSDAGGSDLPPQFDRGDRDRIFAAGPEVNYFMPSQMLFLSLRGLTEFGSRGRPEGLLAAMTLTKAF